MATAAEPGLGLQQLLGCRDGLELHPEDRGDPDLGGAAVVVAVDLVEDRLDFARRSSSPARVSTANADSVPIVRSPLDKLHQGHCKPPRHMAWHLANVGSLAPVEDAGSLMHFPEHINDPVKAMSCGSTRSTIARQNRPMSTAT
jgi:hypothetical protein